MVFGGHNIIAENGAILKQAKRYHNEIIYSELDIQRIVSERYDVQGICRAGAEPDPVHGQP